MTGENWSVRSSVTLHHLLTCFKTMGISVDSISKHITIITTTITSTININNSSNSNNNSSNSSSSSRSRGRSSSSILMARSLDEDSISDENYKVTRTAAYGNAHSINNISAAAAATEAAAAAAVAEEAISDSSSSRRSSRSSSHSSSCSSRCNSSSCSYSCCSSCRRQVSAPATQVQNSKSGMYLHSRHKAKFFH